ncbi:glycoside hydrolase superfamily [Plectosphaerella plurivora]|uniref:beta-glucosidase n=1 Tax=Plectosphaerella plurivora TaxID=936078 RepID=A0A9P8V772_9PEZI|nr:glycoside hydrolase superfamily [Plectosphaerella plurivora]
MGETGKTLETSADAGFDVEHVMDNASLTEKVSLLSGSDFWHTTPLPRFQVPSIRMSDGPNGVRGTKFFDGVKAACLPCGTGLAATWDVSLIREAGVLIGHECIAKGAHCWLGPTVCIQRSPLGGRSFESLSEDPYVTGKLAAAYIQGVQSTGVVSTIKHWLANDQEHERVAVNAVVGQRALREIHMLPFQIALSDAHPGSVMACYNRVNGGHVSESKHFLDVVLREEWGWKGLVMSDWFGTYSTAEALNAGLDLEMPGPSRLRGPLAELAVSTRKVTRDTIDERVRKVLNFVKRASQVQVAAEESGRDYPEDRKLNRKLAADSVVLFKNETGTLPLNATSKPFKSIALIGPNMKTAAFCGGGSASLEPYYTVTPYEGITSYLPPDVEVKYELGAPSYGYIPALTAPHVRTPEGQPGLRMRFYKEPPTAGVEREVIHETTMDEAVWQLMGFSHPRLKRLFFADIEADLEVSESGLYEFGLPVYGNASLYLDGQLLIDNTTSQRNGTFFLGKGTIEETNSTHLVQGTTYKIKVEFASGASSKLIKPGVVNFGGGAGRLGMIPIEDEDVAIMRAVEAAKSSDVAIVCAGLTNDHESEGYDRQHMDLPRAVPKLLDALLQAVPDIIVVSQSGSPFSMPWASRAKTHVHAWFGGNETGNGIADVLFGAVNPSGKLPVSFPEKIEHTPTYFNFGSERGTVVYGEGIYVGYRFYEKVLRNVLYPFGHGLSYTTFEFSNLTVTATSATLSISNTGKVPGAETIQLYIGANKSGSIGRPEKELKGFTKVFLQPGESRRVEIPFDRFTTAFWDEEKRAWSCEKGEYKVLVGSSSQRMHLEGVLTVEQSTTWTGL